MTRTARVFKSGIQFDADEMEILRRGQEVVLRERPRNLAAAVGLLVSLPDDFMVDGRKDAPPQKREAL